MIDEPPKTVDLRSLACKHLEGILPELEGVISMQQQQEESFYSRVFESLTSIDQSIPGPGIHTAIQNDQGRYDYPFNQYYEFVLRSLRYIPAVLQLGYSNSLQNRYIVLIIGGYLEGCIKTSVCNKDRLKKSSCRKKPLGVLIKKGYLNGLLDSTKIPDLTDLKDAVNRAKHDYVNERGPGSLFSYEDALYAYFLARRFGAEILQAAGHMPRLEAAVDNAIEKGLYFRGASLPLS